MKINPVALLNISLGSLALYYMFNKKPPEWMILASAGVALVGVVRESQNLFVNNETSMAGLADCGCHSTQSI